MLTSAEIRATTFTLTRWRAGYDKHEVDAFLARVSLAIDTENALSVAEVRSVRFTTIRFREGYNQEQVNDLLDRLAQASQ